MQSNFLKANWFDLWSKEEGVYPLSSIPVFFSCSLILQWIFKYFCDLFIAAQCSASQSYFQVDMFTGMREGRHVGLYMGGAALGLWQCAATCLGELLFVVVWRVLWHFLVLPLRGRKSQSWPGFISLPVQFTGVLFERTRRKGRVIYVIGSVASGKLAACWHFFIRLCVTPWWPKHWKQWQPGETYHPTVQCEGDPILRIKLKTSVHGHIAAVQSKPVPEVY